MERYRMVYMIGTNTFSIKDLVSGRFVAMGLQAEIARLETMLLNSEVEVPLHPLEEVPA